MVWEVVCVSFSLVFVIKHINQRSSSFFLAFREIVCPEKAGQYNLVVQYIVDNAVKLASRKVCEH